MRSGSLDPHRFCKEKHQCQIQGREEGKKDRYEALGMIFVHMLYLRGLPASDLVALGRDLLQDPCDEADDLGLE